MCSTMHVCRCFNKSQHVVPILLAKHKEIKDDKRFLHVIPFKKELMILCFVVLKPSHMNFYRNLNWRNCYLH